MKHWPKAVMIVSAAILCVLSYGFIDPHLSFSNVLIYQTVQSIVVMLVYRHSIVAAGIYAVLLGVMYMASIRLIEEHRAHKDKKIPGWLFTVIGLLLISYPAFSYDIFNYIATAKVTFQYQENPYVIMPIEIPNEPMLSYTRAANKLALYGPTWIAFTSFPFLSGFGKPFATIVSFKLLVGFFYAAVVYMIYRKTKRWDATLWFAANPLVLIEVLVNGHNDITMMALALGGIVLWQRENRLIKVSGIVLWAASVCIKGATIVLLPLFFFPPKDWGKIVIFGFWLMFLIFLISPFREEMYPWYAVWWLSFAAFTPMKKQSCIHGFSYWLSFGLMLRYLPWIATREYGGITPAARIILTVIPVIIYLVLSLKSLKRSLRLLKSSI